jgi:hypothetical protein
MLTHHIWKATPGTILHLHLHHLSKLWIIPVHAGKASLSSIEPKASSKHLVLALAIRRVPVHTHLTVLFAYIPGITCQKLAIRPSLPLIAGDDLGFV